MLSLPNADALAVDVIDDRLMPLMEVAQLTGCSVATLRRMGDAGPPITKISDRRAGVRVRHFREWLDARAMKRAG